MTMDSLSDRHKNVAKLHRPYGGLLNNWHKLATLILDLVMVVRQVCATFPSIIALIKFFKVFSHYQQQVEKLQEQRVKILPYPMVPLDSDSHSSYLFMSAVPF